jgi:hypothetical protein
MAAAWIEANERLAALLLLALAFALRAGLAASGGIAAYTSDSATYITMADAILDGAPMSFFPNGLPLLLAAIARLTGEMDPRPLWLLMYVTMSIGIVGTVYLIARRWMSAPSALCAAAVIALWPTQLYYACQVLSDVPATFFLVLGTWCALTRRPLAAGLLLGAAIMVRDSLLPAVLLLATIGFVDRDRRRDMTLLLVAVAGVQIVDRTLQWLDVTGPPDHLGLNLLLAVTAFSTDGVPSAPTGVTPEQLAHPIATYLRFAIEHPGTFIAQRLASLYELWGPWPNTGDVDTPRGVLPRLVIGLRFPLLVLALVGLWIGRHRAETWMVAAPLVALTAIHIAFFSASPRFTVPMEPAAIVLAAVAVRRFVRPA